MSRTTLARGGGALGADADGGESGDDGEGGDAGGAAEDSVGVVGCELARELLRASW